MQPVFRPAGRADVSAVIALLADDMLGQGRESADPARYLAAFDAMQAEGANHLIVGAGHEAVDEIFGHGSPRARWGLDIWAKKKPVRGISYIRYARR